MASPAVIEGDIPRPCRFEAVAEGGDGVIALQYSRILDSEPHLHTWRRRVNARTFERLLDILGADLATEEIGRTVVAEYDYGYRGRWAPRWIFKVARESKTSFRMAIRPEPRPPSDSPDARPKLYPDVSPFADVNQYWSMVMDHGDLSGFAEKAIACAARALSASDLTKGRIID